MFTRNFLFLANAVFDLSGVIGKGETNKQEAQKKARLYSRIPTVPPKKPFITLKKLKVFNVLQDIVFLLLRNMVSYVE